MDNSENISRWDMQRATEIKMKQLGLVSHSQINRPIIVNSDDDLNCYNFHTSLILNYPPLIYIEEW